MLKEDFIIPAGEGKMFTVKKGQTLRVIQVEEGVQAADLIVFNEHDMKETFSAWVTRHISKCFTRAEKLYSKLPAQNVMFTISTEKGGKSGMLWLSPGRCNRFSYERRGIKGHNNCQDILAKIIEPYGLTPWDVPEVLNIFVNAVFHEDGTYEWPRAPVSKGDYMDFLAEMDCLVGVSMCPDDMNAYNDFKAKPLGFKIFD